MADRSVVVRLVADIAGYASSMAVAAKSTADFGESAVLSAAKHKQAWEQVSKVPLIAGAALAVLAGAAVFAAAEFDAQMSVVKANIDDKTAPAMKRLEDAALSAGKTTAYSATEAAKGEEELAKAGLTASEITGGALTAALTLASAGQLDLGTAAEVTASTMVQFGLKASDAAHIADVLAAGADKSLGGVTDLAEGLKYAGVPAAQFGVSLDTTVGVLAEFASNGILGSMAGTSLRQMLISLANPTTAASEEMKQLGLNFFDAQGKFVGVAEMAGQLKTRLAGLSDEQRQQTLVQMFGARSLAEANILYRDGAEGVRKWTKDVNDQGFATLQAATKLDNLSGDMTKFKNAINAALIETGQSAQAPLRGIVQELTGVVNAYGSLPASIQGAVLNIAGATAAVLIAVGGFISLSVKIGETVKAFKELEIASKLSMFSGPIGLAVVAATVAFGFFAKSQIDAAASSEELRQTLDQTTGAITDSTAVLVAHRLQADGVSELYKGMGIGFGTMTQAALGNAAAMKTVDDAQKQNETTLTSLAAKHGDLTQAEYDQLVVADQQSKAFANLQKYLHGVTAELDPQIKKQEEVGAATEAATAATGGQTAAAKVNAATLKAQDAALKADEGAIKAVTKANDDLIKSMETYGNLLSNARGATRDYEATTDAAGKALKDFRDGLIKTGEEHKMSKKAAEGWADAQIRGGAALDISTEAGRKNQAALDKISDASLKMAAETFKNRDATTSLSGAVDTATQQVMKGRDAFINSATGFGMSRDAADRLADQLGLTTTNVSRLSGTVEAMPTMHNTNITAATSQTTDAIDSVQRRIAGVQDKTVSISVVGHFDAAAQQAVTMGSGRQLDVTSTRMLASGGTDLTAGLAWVGEQGPELMYVPGGSSIYDHNQSMAMAARFSMNALDFATRRQPAPADRGDSSMHVTVNPSPGMDEYALAHAVVARMMV